MRGAPDKSTVIIRHLVERVLASGQLTRQEHLQLASSLLADEQKVSAADRQQINRIFDDVRMGRFKLTD